MAIPTAMKLISVALMVLVLAGISAARTLQEDAAGAGAAAKTISPLSPFSLNRKAVAAAKLSKSNVTLEENGGQTGARAFPAMKVYGLNCGPGQHAYDTAIDQLDWGCWDHDNCYYDEEGESVWWNLARDYVYCDCDRALISRASAESKYGSLKKKLAAKAIITYFRFQMWSAGC